MARQQLHWLAADWQRLTQLLRRMMGLPMVPVDLTDCSRLVGPAPACRAWWLAACWHRVRATNSANTATAATTPPTTPTTIATFGWPDEPRAVAVECSRGRSTEGDALACSQGCRQASMTAWFECAKYLTWRYTTYTGSGCRGGEAHVIPRGRCHVPLALSNRTIHQGKLAR